MLDRSDVVDVLLVSQPNAVRHCKGTNMVLSPSIAESVSLYMISISKQYTKAPGSSAYAALLVIHRRYRGSGIVAPGREGLPVLPLRVGGRRYNCLVAIGLSHFCYVCDNNGGLIGTRTKRAQKRGAEKIGKSVENVGGRCLAGWGIRAVPA
jgi:hypothetical protein